MIRDLDIFDNSHSHRQQFILVLDRLSIFLLIVVCKNRTFSGLSHQPCLPRSKPETDFFDLLTILKNIRMFVLKICFFFFLKLGGNINIKLQTDQNV